MKKWADAFNCWMDEYINNPEAFQTTTRSVLKHLEEKANGKPLSYGERTAAVFQKYLQQVEQ